VLSGKNHKTLLKISNRPNGQVWNFLFGLKREIMVKLTMLEFNIITIFPKIIEAYCQESIIKRGQANGLLKINVHNLRDYTTDKHHTTDDKPYGGGAGMIMMVKPIAQCLQALNLQKDQAKSQILLTSARGQKLTQSVAQELVQLKKITLLCGHYEGVDQRVTDYLVDGELSIGDYVLTGGELAALVVLDSVSRLVPDVIKPVSLAEESFSLGGNEEFLSPTKVGTPNDASQCGILLEYPQYTRPENFNGWSVPEVLLSGNHAEIAKWRAEQCR